NQLETLHQPLLIPVLLREWTHLHRIIDDEGWLHIMVFAFLTEDLIDEFAFTHRIVNMNSKLAAGITKLILIHLAHINSCMLLYCIVNADAFVWCFERNVSLADSHIARTSHIDGCLFKQLFRNL